jgi:hypothetical protein
LFHRSSIPRAIRHRRSFLPECDSIRDKHAEHDQRRLTEPSQSRSSNSLAKNEQNTRTARNQGLRSQAPVYFLKRSGQKNRGTTIERWYRQYLRSSRGDESRFHPDRSTPPTASGTIRAVHNAVNALNCSKTSHQPGSEFRWRKLNCPSPRSGPARWSVGRKVGLSDFVPTLFALKLLRAWSVSPLSLRLHATLAKRYLVPAKRGPSSFLFIDNLHDSIGPALVLHCPGRFIPK